MFKHLLFILTSKIPLKRIGFRMSSSEDIKSSMIPSEIKDILLKYDLTIHRLSTDSITEESIKSDDPYFIGVEFYTDVNEFKEAIEDFKLSILPKPVTFTKVLLKWLALDKLDKLQLQKILYIIYSQCLVQGIKIFADPPVAYKYGPVFEDVYREFKDTKGPIEVTPTYIEEAKVYKAFYKTEVFDIIKDIIYRTHKLKGGTLIDITHEKDGPWDRVYEEGKNNVIEDDIIIKYNQLVMNRLNATQDSIN